MTISPSVLAHGTIVVVVITILAVADKLNGATIGLAFEQTLIVAAFVAVGCYHRL